MKTSNLFTTKKITKAFILASVLTSLTSVAQVNVISNGNAGIGTGISLTTQTKLDLLYTGNAFSTGPIYGGHFINSNTVTGTTNPYVYGFTGIASGTESNGSAYHYGVAGSAINAYNCVAISGVATLLANGTRAYGGYFNASSPTATQGICYGSYNTASGSQNNYGVYAISTYANTNTGSVNYGIYAQASGALTNYAGYFNGNIYGNAISATTGNLITSDKKFKTKIDAVTNPSDILKHLKPKSYFYDTTANNGMRFSGKKQYGFIAQELQEILPELVYNVTKPADLDSAKNIIHPAIDHLAINYNAFIPILTAAMQAQQSKMDSMVTLTNKQDSINKSLQSQINQIVTNCCRSSVGSNSSQSTTNNALATGINSVGGATNSNAILYQNAPNPFSQSTVVKCLIPQNCQAASLLVFDMNGSLKKTIAINGKGEVNTTINGNQLVSGMYYYTLLIDGQEIDTKKMILTE